MRPQFIGFLESLETVMAGKTVFAIAHRLINIISHMDRIVVMDEGKIIEDIWGNHTTRSSKNKVFMLIFGSDNLVVFWVLTRPRLKLHIYQIGFMPITLLGEFETKVRLSGIERRFFYAVDHFSPIPP